MPPVFSEVVVEERNGEPSWEGLGNGSRIVNLARLAAFNMLKRECPRHCVGFF